MLSLKYFVLALAAVAEAGKLYGCAGTCIGKAITATGCSSSNSQCICSSVLFMETIKDCAASDCSEAQTESALTVAEQFCNLIGDDLPQLTHEKRSGRPGHFRGGHGHGPPAWLSNAEHGGASGAWSSTASASTPAAPAQTSAPPKHAQPPAPAHSHPARPITTAADPTYTRGPPAPEHTVF